MMTGGEQLSFPWVKGQWSIEQERYVCECGSVDFIIGNYGITCSGCGQRYADDCLPPTDFNEERDVRKI